MTSDFYCMVLTFIAGSRLNDILDVQLHGEFP